MIARQNLHKLFNKDEMVRGTNRAPITDVGRRVEVYKVLRTMNKECSRPSERDENSRVVNSVKCDNLDMRPE